LRRDFRPQARDYQLLSTGFLYRFHEPRVLPGVDKRTVDRLPVGKDILDSVDDVPATLFQNRRENCRDVKYFRCLRQPRDVVHDELSLVTMKIGELERLMINEQKSAFFWS
jgi:hypothetical protein